MPDDRQVGAGPPGPGSRRAGRTGPRAWSRRILVFAVTALCFAYLYVRLSGAAAREGLTLAAYMATVFANVAWLPWLGLMMAYSCLYLTIDTFVTTKALGWFVKEIPFRDVLPIRASAYIISIVNEQVGKGAMAYYLNRRDGVPGWEVGSVMLFIMFCEVLYLLTWATIGYFVTGSSLPGGFGLIPPIAAGAALLFAAWYLFFRGRLLPGSTLRDRRILHAFRMARLRHYLLFFLFRSPALLSAVVVYTVALNLFGVEAELLQLLGYLPVIFFAATVPTPMRAAAITSWVILFPGNEGQVAAFGLVQHNFFIFFNATIGLLFLRRAQRELFDT